MFQIKVVDQPSKELIHYFLIFLRFFWNTTYFLNYKTFLDNVTDYLYSVVSTVSQKPINFHSVLPTYKTKLEN